MTNNKLVITGSELSLLGLDFKSRSGSLIPATGPVKFTTVDVEAELGDPSAAPFQFFLSNSPNQITLGNLGRESFLNGSVTLGIGWSFGAADLTVDYGAAFTRGAADVDDLLDGGVSRHELDKLNTNIEQANRSVYFNQVDF